MIEFELKFDGGFADQGLIEFYDAAKALAGFQRSLALTTHLAINGEIITQAPYARGFKIFVPPFQEGSWKTKAIIVLGATVTLTSAGKDSPLGHLVTSIYDAALYNTMGFHVDYDKTLQQLYSENSRPSITPEKLDSLCEKIENSIADMHRPIVISETATRAQVEKCGSRSGSIGPVMSPMTYEYVKQTRREDEESFVDGFVSSYNINTFTGRLYSEEEGRPIPFELEEGARVRRIVGMLTRSQHINGQSRFDPKARVRLHCHKLTSPNRKIKRLSVSSVDSFD
ncbi:hypothetical protein [Sphingopyxis lindanitolerans]|uniref:DUF7946 domain-containing protein n=1 Tax=Sphingopyxis lindanitolerans TaxID=2054227 RepID=UPI0011B20855|nr:hypothetical protein [Sphingopyxis lindanitolerans]